MDSGLEFAFAVSPSTMNAALLDPWIIRRLTFVQIPSPRKTSCTRVLAWFSIDALVRETAGGRVRRALPLTCGRGLASIVAASIGLTPVCVNGATSGSVISQ